MITVVEPPLAFSGNRTDGVEFKYVDARLAQAVEKSLWRIDAAEAVIDHIDLNAPVLLRQQQVGKLAADFIVLNDVGLKIDMIPSGPDCGKHGGISRRAILQQGDLIAHDQGAADDGLLQSDLLVDDINVAGLAFQGGDDRSTFLGRDRPTRILETGGLRGMPSNDDIRIRQCRATHRGKQKSGYRYGQFARRIYLAQSGHKLLPLRWQQKRDSTFTAGL